MVSRGSGAERFEPGRGRLSSGVDFRRQISGVLERDTAHGRLDLQAPCKPISFCFTVSAG